MIAAIEWIAGLTIAFSVLILIVLCLTARDDPGDWPPPLRSDPETDAEGVATSPRSSRRYSLVDLPRPSRIVEPECRIWRLEIPSERGPS